MSTNWLANADNSTFWAHHAWPEFKGIAERENALAVLPLYGFADHGMGLPLDAEEIVGGAILRDAVVQTKALTPVLALPPLRFVLAPYPFSFFGLDPETAAGLIQEVAAGVKSAGFKKLLFFCTSPWNAEFIDSVSRDIRVSQTLQTFVITLDGLDLDFHPASVRRTQTQAAVAHLLGASPPASSRTGNVVDANFRPGNFRQPPPVAIDRSIDGARLVKTAGDHLVRLLIEASMRAPLGKRNIATTVVWGPSAATCPQTPWPAYRSRYLTALTRDEIEILPNKERALVILPVGAIEQHGHHLPVGVDAILGQALLTRALEKLEASAPVYVAPPITFGKSNEHTAFPGTLSISAITLRRLVIALATQLKALGFRQIALFNTHGGNSAVLVYTLREIQATLGMRAGMVSSPFKPDVSAQEAEYGFHAGEVETSLMLEIAAEWVRMEKAVCEYPAQLDDPGELRPENAPVVFSWATEDISKSGVMGDATVATKDKGSRWLAGLSEGLATRIKDLIASG